MTSQSRLGESFKYQKCFVVLAGLAAAQLSKTPGQNTSPTRSDACVPIQECFCRSRRLAKWVASPATHSLLEPVIVTRRFPNYAHFCADLSIVCERRLVRV